MGLATLRIEIEKQSSQVKWAVEKVAQGAGQELSIYRLT
jgi:hypothetical protein